MQHIWWHGAAPHATNAKRVGHWCRNKVFQKHADLAQDVWNDSDAVLWLGEMRFEKQFNQIAMYAPGGCVHAVREGPVEISNSSATCIVRFDGLQNRQVPDTRKPQPPPNPTYPAHHPPN